jgi:5,5'-dehydrodivanillate O-demethylase
MLRRYWWPIATADSVGKTPNLIKLLGETFVAFRDEDGKVGLLDRKCSHRGASLEFGRVEKNGLRCCYHGWLFDRHGNCLDQPCEPENSNFKSRIRQRAYPVHEVAGLVFTYIGPGNAPIFPKYDLLYRNECNKTVYGRDMQSNWLQRAENMMDMLHVMCLHASLYPELAFKRPLHYDWTKRWYGFQMDLTYPNGTEDRHHYVFPFINRVQVMRAGQEPYQFMQWVSPQDNTHCISYQIWASELSEGPYTLQTGKFQHTIRGEYKRVDDGFWNIWERDQDDVATDSQGVIADRSDEHLGVSDRGIILLRKMVRDAIDKVIRGEDPPGLIRDPEHEIIDLYAWKTDLGAEPGKVRAEEIGKKLKIIQPFDL